MRYKKNLRTLKTAPTTTVKTKKMLKQKKLTNKKHNSNIIN